MVDWKALKAKKTEVKPMMALVLGASGSGKSSSMGTIGLPTLILQGKVESHSTTAAKATSKDKSLVTGLDYTITRPDGSLDSQASYKNLLEILRDATIADNFGAVVIDGASELQTVFKDTAKFRELCLSDKGIHNSFKEPEAYGVLFSEVINCLLMLQSRGVHVFMTCAAIITGGGDTSDEITARPNLYGFTVSENLCRNFSDIFFVNMCREEDADGNENSVHRFVFNPKVSAITKDIKTGKVTKQSFSNFSPRISYFTREQLPEKSEVDFAAIIKARKEKSL